MRWDEDLQALERAISVVNAEYDAFLYGSATKPPIESRRNVERLIRRLSAQEPETAAERFRFSTIQGRWSTLEDRWERLQAEKEAGRRPGLYGHFRPSRAVEAGTSPPSSLNAPESASVRETEEPPSDPRRTLFEKYVAARKARGDTADGFDFERFTDSLVREENRLKDRFGGAEVEFDVTERDGQVKLVARKKKL